MNILATILAKTTTGAVIEIIIILLVAGAIAFITAYFIYRSVYLKKIGILEEEKSALSRQNTTLEREVADLKNRISELEKKE
jgi:Tfp pilus assembly protein PilE